MGRGRDGWARPPPPRARPDDPTPSPPDPLLGRRAPQLTSVHVRALHPTMRCVGRCGEPVLGFAGAPRHLWFRNRLKFCGAFLGGASDPGVARPKTLGAPCSAADAIVCSAPCLSPLPGSVSDGVWPREEGRHRRPRDPRNAGPEPTPRLSPLFLILIARNCDGP
jgi:hypothetical protein